MTIRDRIKTVYAGGTPDFVPLMLDMQHWFYQKNGIPWDIGKALKEPDQRLIDFHKSTGIGFFMPNLADFMSVEYGSDVTAKTEKRNINGKPAIVWSYDTPLGSISRTRIWEEKSYSWGIWEWGIKTEQDIKVLTYAMSRRRFSFNSQIYAAWAEYTGIAGVVYAFQPGYSGAGCLLNAWMGIEATVFACLEWEDTVCEAIDTINAGNLRFIDMLASSDAEVILMGDNFSSDIQPKWFFDKWTRDYYKTSSERLHNADKYVAVHIDGRLKGAIEYIREAGADCIDAVTPKPMGDLTPQECREEAGTELILSGGISPNYMLEHTSTDDFKAAVIEWLDLRRQSPALIMAVGDEVPVGACEDRLRMLPELVEKYGRY